MPIKDLQKRREYHRDYMRQRRKSLTGRKSLNLSQKFNPSLPHQHTSTMIDGVWRRTLIQAGKLYDRDSGNLIESTE